MTGFVPESSIFSRLQFFRLLGNDKIITFCRKKTKKGNLGKINGHFEPFGVNENLPTETTARSREDKTRNARRNANQNPRWW